MRFFYLINVKRNKKQQQQQTRLKKAFHIRMVILMARSFFFKYACVKTSG